MQPAGGITRYFLELIRQLSSRHNCRCSVFAGFHASSMLSRERSSLGARVIGWRMPFGAMHNRLASLANQVLFRALLMRSSPEIYHSTYYRPYRTPAATARVITVHDMIAELFPHGGIDPTPQRKRSTIMAADRIICVSQNTKRDLVRFYPAVESRVSVIYHGASIPGSLLVQKPVTERYFLYVGTREARKNTSMIRYAFERADLQGVKLVFFGGRDPDAEERASQRSGRCVFMRGDDDCLASLYRHATALLYPSLYEGFGMPLIEAMSYGCPVIASNTSCFPEVAGNAALLLDPQDQAAWAHAIQSLSRNQPLRESLSRRGRLHSESFTWAKCAEETIHAYKLAAVDRT
jgi:glycosyltransferase involved in cell wall biosynthesis